MIYNLQILRAIAAFLVLFVHIDLFARPLGIETRWLEFGNAGVDLFFVLSGFLMVHTASRKPPAASAFAANRVLRVVPLYWVCTLAVFLIAATLPELLGATRASWLELLKSLMFIPFVKSNGLAMPVLFVGWTLNYEMFFYAVFAAFLWLTRSNVRRTAFLSIGMLALIVIFGAWFRSAPVEVRFFTHPIVLEFALGMGVALALGQDRTIPRGMALPLLAVALASLIYGALLGSGLPRAIVCGIPAAIVLLCAVSLERSGNCLRHRTVQLLGDASYALYLTHAFVLQGIGKLLPAKASTTTVLLAMVGAFALAQCLAILVHMMVERPMTRRLRLMFQRHRTAPVQTTPALAGEL